MGLAWMQLDSEYGALWGENSESEGFDLRGQIIQEMYADFSDPADWQAQIRKWQAGADAQEEHAVEESVVLDGDEGHPAVMLDLVPGSAPVVKNDRRNKCVHRAARSPWFWPKRLTSQPAMLELPRARTRSRVLYLAKKPTDHTTRSYTTLCGARRRAG